MFESFGSLNSNRPVLFVLLEQEGKINAYDPT